MGFLAAGSILTAFLYLFFSWQKWWDFIESVTDNGYILLCICIIWGLSSIGLNSRVCWAWVLLRCGAVPGAELRKLCGVCAAAVGSSRRLCRGPAVCCTPRPPPRFPSRLLRSPPARPVWSWAPSRSSSAILCAGSGTKPERNHNIAKTQVLLKLITDH